ncbi:GntR family transcriptional regulator [Methylocapsa sp. S129]|uniref:GntR family transcriptional regulator n=1 Tax=Methylocapsa sp. S129 TaxID=1641869 RepID=UPI00131AA68C|nr:GntR family transcriptional regulator [Methylocapsa sp. S129]
MEYRTKEDQVADFLREEIISGRLARGTRLKQQEIAQQMKISITPVREALKLLEAEGYLSSGSYRGATVVPFDIGTSTEILKLRIMLETQLVESAARKLNSENIAELRDLADQFDKAAHEGDSTVARGVNYRFHRRIYDFANLPQTLHFVQVLWARYPFDVINRIDGRASRAAEEHAELLRRFIEGDVSGAMLTMRRHIEAGWSEFRESLERQAPAPPSNQPSDQTESAEL